MGTLKNPELKQYIYRKLGHPVINVEVDETQMEDCIDEAMKTFLESHYDASEIGYVALATQEGVSEYELPEGVQDVMEVLNTEGNSGPGLGSIDPGDPFVWPWRGGGYRSCTLEPCEYWDVVSVEVWRQRWQLYEDTWRVYIPFEFNQISKKLYFPDAPDVDGIRYLKVAQTATAVGDPDGNLVLDALWLKKYAVALARIQWSVNVGKYEGAQLPGGVSINWQAIGERGDQEKEQLLTELDEKYSLPPDPVFA